MLYVGIDLHKQTIVIRGVNQARELVSHGKFFCQETTRIVEFFRQLGRFQAVIEATASYEWLWELLEPLAERLVLAHPGKMRVIAESRNKNDKVDAHVLAVFLALDMIPAAHRPTPRQREHRALVRHRSYLRRGTTSAKNKIRRILSDYNADRKDLFTSEGLQYLAEFKVSAAARLVLDQLLAKWEHLEKQITALDKALKAFAKKAPAAEKEAREVLASIPQVGDGTVDVVVSELGDVRRFSSAKKVAAYAGLVPGQRESAGHKKELGISKQGSRLLRWSLVEAAWRLVRKSPRWCTIFEGISKRRGKKKAIVAVARRLLSVMVAMLRSGKSYRFAASEVQAGLNA